MVSRRRRLATLLERLGLDQRAGGRLAAPVGTTTPAFFTARYQAQTTGAVSPIKSEYRSRSFEINDTIRLDHWTFNIGILASNDTSSARAWQRTRRSL